MYLNTTCKEIINIFMEAKKLELQHKKFKTLVKRQEEKYNSVFYEYTEIVPMTDYNSFSSYLNTYEKLTENDKINILVSIVNIDEHFAADTLSNIMFMTNLPSTQYSESNLDKLITNCFRFLERKDMSRIIHMLSVRADDSTFKIYYQDATIDGIVVKNIKRLCRQRFDELLDSYKDNDLKLQSLLLIFGKFVTDTQMKHLLDALFKMDSSLIDDTVIKLCANRNKTLYNKAVAYNTLNQIAQ